MAARPIGRTDARPAEGRAEVWSGSTAGNPDWSRVAPASLTMPTYKRAAYDALAEKKPIMTHNAKRKTQNNEFQYLFCILRLSFIVSYNPIPTNPPSASD